MRILIVSQEYPPRTGGAGVVAHQNALALTNLGHEVTVLTRAWGDESVKQDVNIVSVGGLYDRFWPLYMAIQLRQLNLEKFDSIILNDIGAAFCFASFIKDKKIYSRVVLYLHGGEVQSILVNPKGYLRWTYFKRRYIKLIESCKCVIAVSMYMKEYFLENFPAKVDESKFKVIYAGVDCSIFKPIETSIRFDFGITANETLLLSVARIIEEKGFSKMLSIFEKALEKNSNIYWVIIGDGPFLEQFKQEVSLSKASSNIYLLGAINRKELNKYYSAADLFWLMSERESFGLAYLEAQLCGCPAMGPDGHGVKEAINHGLTGHLAVSMEDCLNYILTQDFKNLERNSVARAASDFCVNKQVEKLETLIQ